MSRMLLITDDPQRSKALAREISCEMDCQVHDLNDDALPVGSAAAMLSDISDFGLEAERRMRRILARAQRDAPLVVLLRHDSSRARLSAIALGATHVLSLPFDFDSIRSVLAGPPAPSDPPDPLVRGRAEAARQFYGSVFVPNQAITPVVIDNGTELIEQTVREVGIRDWIDAVRRFDDVTHQHCLLVAGLATAFAGSLGLGAIERHRLVKASLLHDVGKLQVPLAILNKPGKLDPEEMALVRLHPERGEAMLAGQGFEPEQLAVVRSHHEMLDGSGYPDRLKGGEIPDLVRLVTICDIYGALIERRSYKPPMTGEAAFAIIQEMIGKLDPALVSAFGPVAGAFTMRIPCEG